MTAASAPGAAGAVAGPVPAAAPASPPRTARSDAIDVLRGFVMVLMALDHTRDYFGDGSVRPTDLARASVALFLTRWITHFCAPVFVLLAGTAAYLSRGRGRDTAALARFLLSRGLWLVVLEVTVVRLGWQFDLSYRFTMLQVIWAIGWSMVALAALCWLPTRVVAVVGCAMIAGHNLLDGVHVTAPGAGRALWSVAHEMRVLEPLRGHRVLVAYPLVPWIGVMAVGYALGAWMRREPAVRQRWFAWLGAGLIVAFIALRASRLYGDPRPFAVQRDAVYTVLAFLNCQKYPPSLLYLLMTLGPALCALAWLDSRATRAGGEGPGVLARVLLAYGRVPLFYYVAHLFLIHAAAVAWVAARYGVHANRAQFEAGLRFGLPGVYLVWLGVVAALYAPCRWFAGVKQRRRDWWLSYL